MQNELILATHAIAKHTQYNAATIIDVEVLVDDVLTADKPDQVQANTDVSSLPVAQVPPANPGKEHIQNVAPSALKINPLNFSLYGDEVLDPQLIDSVNTTGVQVPLIVTTGNVVIAGHRRLRVALELKMESVPVIVREFPDALSEEVALVENNRQRIKTNEMVGKEALKLAEIETQRAKQRQKEGGSLKGAKKASSSGEAGSARDRVGKKVGVSGPTAQYLMETTKAVQELVKIGNDKDAEELRVALNKSVSKGHALAKVMGVVKTAGRKAVAAAAPKDKEVSDKSLAAAPQKPVAKESAESPYAQENDTEEIADMQMFIKWLRRGVRFLEDYTDEISDQEKSRCETLFRDLRTAMMDCGIESHAD